MATQPNMNQIKGSIGFTTTELEDVSDLVNTSNKQQFKIVGNTTTNRLVYASGSADSDDWLFMDGTTAHTPV